MNILVTGGAGFIGSALVRYLINNTDHHIINIDKLSYAADLNNLVDVCSSSRYHFEQVDIADTDNIERIFLHHQPDIVFHLAAESHVDNSIAESSNFIQTNIVGTYVLLEVSRRYWNGLSGEKKANFRFHHVSTDEVYGDLAPHDAPFTEQSRYFPSSPYSATKASADHLIRAWHRTYGLPIIISSCSNNYGPYQHHEKLIPKMITQAFLQKPLPIYGSGLQIRDWIHVEDHVAALYLVATQGRIGDTYNIGGSNEVKNIDLVRSICAYVDDITDFRSIDLIIHVADRAGHDQRYALSSDKIMHELGWKPAISFQMGLHATVDWYAKTLGFKHG